MSANDDEGPSYIDYETFLAPDFSPATFANSLVLSTNNPNDTPLDLSTPLSRVLFDIQEIDSHIDTLTTKSAIPLLEFTQAQTAASKKIVGELDTQIKSLNDSYKQLEKEVIVKHAEAEEVHLVAIRLWETLKLGTSVGRCLQLGRKLQMQYAEIAGSSISAATAAAGKKEDHRALVRCSLTILSLREVMEKTAPGEEGHGLNKVEAIRSLQDVVLTPVEHSVREVAERIIRDFSVSSSSTFDQVEEAKARTTSALDTLYLISPTRGIKPDKWTPQLLLQALEAYFRSALTNSITSLARSLGRLPDLEKTLNEIAAKCQNLVALELVLDAAKVPEHPLFLELRKAKKQGNMLQPLLTYLETGSLASYFWRTMASSLPTRVQEITNRGGAAARTLKTNRSNVGDAIKDCVVKGCQLPSALSNPKNKAQPQNWDREVAVMVGSIVNNIGR
jgi:hypothetical protein